MDSFNFTVTAKTASAFRDWLDEQNKEFIEDLLNGKGQFTLEHGDRKIMLAPVKHGKWEYIGGYGYQYRCSECFMCAGYKTNYCPHCGANMEEQE